MVVLKPRGSQDSPITGVVALAAVAGDVTGLAALVALPRVLLFGAVGTVPGDVSGVVAVVARLLISLGTVALDVARLVAIVAHACSE